MSGYGSTSIVESQPMGLGIFNNVFIKSVEAFTTEPKKETDSSYQVLDVMLENEAGETYRIRIFNPDENTDPTKIAKGQERASNTVAYLATKIHGEDKVLDGSKIKDWEGFTAAAIKLIGEYSGKLFQFKTVGNVYNGRANLVTPLYWGWLEPMDSSKKLSYSQSEREANAKYEAFFANKANSGGSSTEDDGDDTPF